jgi:hypothetical protein
MISVFTFTIVVILYAYVVVKFIDTGMSIFWTFIWGLATFGLIGSFMWWVFV